MKIGSMGEDVATMGMGDPEGEDGELIAGADEILAEELSQIVEGLNRVDAGDIVFRFFGCSSRRFSARNWFGGWGSRRLGDGHVEGHSRGHRHPMVCNIGTWGLCHTGFARQGAVFRLQGSVAGPAFLVFFVPSGITVERGK